LFSRILLLLLLLNDCIFRALEAAGIPATQSLPFWYALMASGQTAVLSSHGVVASPSHWMLRQPAHVADSCLQTSYREPDSVAELSANRKEDKYSMLSGSYIFQPLAFKSHGPQNASAISFIKELGHRISQRFGADRETQFLFQQLSVIMQRYNMPFFMARAFRLPLTTRTCNHSTDQFLPLLLIPLISTICGY